MMFQIRMYKITLYGDQETYQQHTEDLLATYTV